jgi:hypothetical protein
MRFLLYRVRNWDCVGKILSMLSSLLLLLLLLLLKKLLLRVGKECPQLL